MIKTLDIVPTNVSTTSPLTKYKPHTLSTPFQHTPHINDPQIHRHK
jgi:hypothetical protein